MKCKILIIGNEIRLAQEMQGILETQGAIVEVAYSGQHGIINAENYEYDLILLDLQLPQLSGPEVLKKLKESNKNTPILIFTSKEDIEVATKCLENGGSDFMIKPVSMKELLDKTNMLLDTKKQNIITSTIAYGDIELNLEEKLLVCGEDSIGLHKKEFQIMALLMYHPEQIFSKHLIIEKFWGEYTLLEKNNVEVHLSLLRKKLHTVNAKTTIRTVRGVGYALTLKT